MLGTLFLGDASTTNDTDPPADAVEAKRVDTVKLDSLGEMLGVDDVSGAPLDPMAETHWVIPLSAPFVAALAALDPTKRGAIARMWAATPEWKADKGDAAWLDRLLADVATLAARSQGKTLFLRIAL